MLYGLGHAILAVKLNSKWGLWSLFLNFALRHSLMPKNGLFHSILCFTETYHGNWLCPGAKFKKGDPTSNSIYWQNIMNLPIETFLKLEKWHWFDFGINFSHFYIVSSNLLPNFLLAVTHSFFNIMLSVIPHTVLLNSDQEKKKLLHSTPKINSNESVLLLYIDI